MMITARGNKGRPVPKALRQLQAKHAAIKPQRAVKVGDLEMYMTDPDVRIYFSHGAVRSDLRPSAPTLLPAAGPWQPKSGAGPQRGYPYSSNS
jgi:hypothetical protein